MAGVVESGDRTTSVSRTGSRIMWVATAVLTLVAVAVAYFAVNLVLWTSRYGGSTYLNEGGLFIGLIAAAVLTGAAVLLANAVTGHAPSGRVIGGIALALVVVMQFAVFWAGEYGESTPAGPARADATIEDVVVAETLPMRQPVPSPSDAIAAVTTAPGSRS